jgi:NADH-ubiquinone oxidoreductase chain 5
MAFPFLTGFYSKDLLLNIAVIPRNATATFAYMLTIVAAFITSCYSVRLIILCFMSPTNLLGMFSDVMSKQTVLMNLPLVILSCLAVVFGYLTSELFLGFQSGGALFSHPNNNLVNIELLFTGDSSLLAQLTIIPVFTL